MNSRRQDGHTLLENNDAVVSRLAQQDKIPWYSKPNLRLLYLLMFPACLGVEMTTGFDASMINSLQAVPSWIEYFHHPHSALLGFMVAVYNLGFIIAVPFVPFVVDKMGRRYPVLLGGLVLMIGGIMQGLALNTTMFIIARFIVGFANIFCLVAAASLVGELSHPNERAVMGCLFGTVYDIGAIAAAGAVLGTFSITNDLGWRIPSLLQVVPSLLQVTFIWFLPESPRWLVSTGRKNEAYAILMKYHAEGNEDSDFVKAEYTQIEQTLEAERKIAKMSWKEVFSTSGMRKRATIALFLGLSVHWCGFGLTSQFLAPVLETIGIHDNRTKNIINLARVSWSLVANTVCAFTAPRYSRRSIYLACTTSFFVVFASWTMASAAYSLTHNKIFAQVVLVLIFVIVPVFDLGFVVILHTFLVELFPFHARARGLSLFQWWMRIAGFTSQVLNPIGIDAFGWKWYIVYCVWNAFQVVFVYFMFPETSGRTLEELTFLYEGDPVFRQTEVEGLIRHQEPEGYHDSTEDIQSP